MSLIPLDEPRGGGPNTGRDGPDDTSLIGRAISGLKAALLALPGASALVSKPAGDRSEATADTDGRDGSRGRKVPATVPGGPPSDRVDVVSTETDDTLTVEAVDNPDAAIRSDTWEPIER